MASSSTAFKSFSLLNDVLEIKPQDEIFKFDVEENKRLLRDSPWTRECVFLTSMQLIELGLKFIPVLIISRYVRSLR